MIKRLGLIAISILLILFTFGCDKKPQTTLSDAEKFKNEYESVNGESTTSGKEYRTIEIAKENPFIYKEASEVVEAINNKETFIVYFGFKTCPWCRSILPTLIDVSKDLKLGKIYYVDVLDIRDTMELKEKNKPETTKEGSKGYYDLLELLDNVLSDYTLKTSKGKTVKTGEKRIFAPNIVAIVKGEAISLTDGISELQTDGYMELTEEMKKESYEKIEKVLRDVVDADISCESGC